MKNKETHFKATIAAKLKVFLLGLLSFGVFAPVIGQDNFNFHHGNVPVVIDETGDTLDHAFVGGFNSPQFQAMDMNNDGNMDLLLFDRSDSKVMVLLWKDGAYVHAPDYENFLPDLQDWIVTNDFNADGKLDLWFRNSLNQSIGLYKNVTESWDNHIMLELVSDRLQAYNYNTDTFFFEDTFYVSNYTDMYCNRPNIPAVQDVDGDGDMDFLTLQTTGAGVTLFLNVSKELGLSLDEPEFEEADMCWGDFVESDTGNGIALNRYKFCTRKVYRHLKKHAGGSTMLLFDNDQDGDMDLLLGNARFEEMIFLENGKSDLSREIDTIINWNTDYPSSQNSASATIFPGSFYVDIDGDGIKDLLVAPNTTDKVSYPSIHEFDNVKLWKNNGANDKPDFQYVQNDFLVSEMVDNGSRGAPALWDYDDDGDLDIILSVTGGYHITRDSADRLYLYENQSDSLNSVYRLVDKDFLGMSSERIRWMVPQIVDINQGGTPELVVGMNNGTLQTYQLINNNGVWSKSLLSKNAFGINVGSAAAPYFTDVNKDNKIDLLVGTYNGNTRYYKNVSSNNVPDLQLEADTFGGVLANGYAWQSVYLPDDDIFVDSFAQLNYGIAFPRLVDIDGDQKREFVVGGAHGNIYIYDNVENNYTGKFTPSKIKFINDVTGSAEELPTFGSVARPVFADLNGDSITDMLVAINRGGLLFRAGSFSLSARSFNPKTSSASLQVYPNPTEDIVNVRIDGNVPETIKVFDLVGKEITTGESGEVSLKHAPAGMYIFQVSSGGKSGATRILKQ